MHDEVTVRRRRWWHSRWWLAVFAVGVLAAPVAVARDDAGDYAPERPVTSPQGFDRCFHPRYGESPCLPSGEWR